MNAQPDPDALRRLAAAARKAITGWEFDSFAVIRRITEFPPGCHTAENRLDFKRAIGDAVADAVRGERPQAERRVQEEADVLVVLSWPTLTCEIEAAPLYVYGRYLKLSRLMPSARWPCRLCRGKGRLRRGGYCFRCHGTGRMYARSVESIVGGILLPLTGATETHMHSCGREDTDARMLGEGRPFSIELRSPRRRRFDTARVQEQINAARPTEVQVRQLAIVTKAVIPLIYDVRPPKRYEALIEVDPPVPAEVVERLSAIRRIELVQRTPARVDRRRADLIRFRWIEILQARPASGTGSFAAADWSRSARLRRFRLCLRAASGTYIKEFINGDQRRTYPNLTLILAVGARCVLLDVTAVEHDPLALLRAGADNPDSPS